jgi:hypothetical protein
MANDPSTGPMPRERLKELVDAPFGKAAEIIRQYDPMWGRRAGEKHEWLVRVERDGTGTGTAFIKAANQDEADELADELTESDIDWDDCDFNGLSIISVEPKA